MNDAISIKTVLDKIIARQFKVIWFRNDDVGRKSDKFFRLNNLFDKYGVSICYAVIPTMLNVEVQEAIKKNAYSVVFQHGYSHQNNSISGKQVELSDDININQLKKKVLEGKKTLEAAFGKQFRAILVPPYNNIDIKIQSALQNDFEGSSTYKSNKTSFNRLINPNCDIVDWDANIVSMQYISSQIDEVKGEVLGVLLHHKYLNEETFSLLENLLSYIKRHNISDNYEEVNR